MARNESGTPARAIAMRDGTRACPPIIFVGTAIAFSDATLRVIEHEFGDGSALRIARLADLPAFDGPPADSQRLLVVDESHAETLIASAGTLANPADAVRIAVAYRDPEVARAVLVARGNLEPRLDLGYLPMKLHLDAWLSAFRLLVLGELFVPSELLAPLQLLDATPALPLNPGPAEKPCAMVPAHPLLTRREEEVLRRVSEGKGNKTVAAELSLSEHTIKLHMHHIIRKLGVHNRTGATLWYLKQPGAPSSRRMADR